MRAAIGPVFLLLAGGCLALPATQPLCALTAGDVRSIPFTASPERSLLRDPSSLGMRWSSWAARGRRGTSGKDAKVGYRLVQGMRTRGGALQCLDS